MKNLPPAVAVKWVGGTAMANFRMIGSCAAAPDTRAVVPVTQATPANMSFRVFIFSSPMYFL
jgi:hypothetical protein